MISIVASFLLLAVVSVNGMAELTKRIYPFNDGSQPAKKIRVQGIYIISLFLILYLILSCLSQYSYYTCILWWTCQ